LEREGFASLRLSANGGLKQRCLGNGKVAMAHEASETPVSFDFDSSKCNGSLA
jgi:hypothetical protein